MRKAVIYLRSSKDRHDVSIDAQRRELQELAKTKGLVLVGAFEDAVERGSTDQRPGFQALITELKSRDRAWDTVLAMDTSRIARGRYIAQAFKHECKKHGVEILFSKVPEVDPISQVILESVLEAMDEVHSLMSREKGLAGMSENIRQGYRAGGRAPFGYQLEQLTNGTIRDGLPVTKTKLVIDPDTAPKISAYLKGRVQGRSAASLSQELDIAMPASSLVGVEWNSLTYAGHTVWNVHNGKTGGSYTGGNKRRPRGEWHIHKNTHEALITEDEAEALLARLEKGRSRYATKSDYLLSGLLVAPDGTPWHGNGGNYRCNKKNIKSNVVEDALLAQLEIDLSAPEFVDAIQSRISELSKADAPDAERKRLQRELAGLDGKISRLSNLLAETSTPEPLLRKIEELEAGRRLMIIRQDEDEREYARAAVLEKVTRKDIQGLLDQVGEILKDLSRDRLKEVLRGLLKKVTLDPVTFEGENHYRVVLASGELVASPRGFEPRYLP
jgi:site-specific DNA recombinase